MLAVRDNPEDNANLEYQLRTQAIRENREMNDLIRDAVALYLEKPPSATAARASFQRLLKDPPVRGAPEEVAACLEEDYYAQRVNQLIN